MGRKQVYIAIIIGLTVFFGYLLVSYDKLGRQTPANLFGLPVLALTAVIVGILMYRGATWRPVRDPGTYVETPGCLLWGFILLFFVAIGLGTYFTEPVVCTGRDGDVCYQYGTMYETQRYDGSSYRYSYRNSWIWGVDSSVRAVDDATFIAGGNFGGDWMSNMDLGDSEAVILIIILVVLVIIVLSAAFVPNMWVLASALCLMCLYLTILRLHNSEVAMANADKLKNEEKPKPSYGQDELLADPASDAPNPELNA